MLEELRGLAKAAVEFGYTAAELLGEEEPLAPLTPDVAAAESALRSAVLARDADVENLALPPDLLAKRLAKHEAAIAQAQVDYEAAVAGAAPQPKVPETEELAAAGPDDLPDLLRRFGLRVIVQPGRGNLGERVALELREVSS